MKTETPRKNFCALRVGAFESRMREEMTRLINNLGGKPFVAPSMREVPIEENREALAFAETLRAGAIDVLIFFTGVGARVLFKVLLLKFSDEELKRALGAVTIVARGPKPLKALGEYGLKPTIIVPEPNTWREILRTLDEKLPLEGKRVAVQEYGEPSRLFLSELKARGAEVTPVPVYRTVMPEDTAPLSQLIERVVRGEIDVLLFTNATQVEHVLAVARRDGRAQELRRALASVVVGSVGPTCSAMLTGLGFPVDFEPARPMMGALVAAAADKSGELLAAKRGSAPRISIADAGVARPGDALHESLFLKACRREKTTRTPVWLMRQAGRYMKEYRELRAKVSFLDLCKNVDLASEVTVDAAHRLGVDAAIIFSDLLLIVEPLGFTLTYEKDGGPCIQDPFRTDADLKRMRPVDVEESMSFVYAALRKTRAALRPDLPLIGFAGSPFTMASYLIEGGASRNFIKTKTLMRARPEVWNALLEKITAATIDYVNGQVAAGAQAIQFFDSWVGCLSPEDFRAHVLAHARRLIAAVRPGVPVISFGTGNSGMLSLFKQAGGDVIGVDWRVELDEAWDLLGDVAIQGNLDPVLLFSTPAEIRSQTRRILTQARGRPGHIFNLGHGILPETPIDNVLALVEAVKEMSS